MKEELQRILWPKGHRPNIWAIVDAAQDQQVYWTLTNSFLPHSCLFAGALPEALEMAAPYLVQLDPEDKFTAYLAKNLGRNVAVFLQSDASLHDLRHHLRTFLTVKDTSGRRMLFRYYDPRVLRVYLPTCNHNELQTVFGPVTAYWTVAEDPKSLTQFEFLGKSLRVIPQPLGVESAGEDLAPVIVPAHRVIAVPRGRSANQRVPILLQGAGKGGLLRRSSPLLRFFRTVTAAEELPFPGGAYSIPPANLEPDVTVYAEAAGAAEVTLTLEPAAGGKTETKVQAVELKLDGGAPEIYAGTTVASRRRIAVRAVEPRPFKGRLTLRTAAGGPELTLFQSATADAGFALAEGYSFDAPKEEISFWIQGTAVSKARGDARLQLFAEGSQIAGDSCVVTVAELKPVAIEIPNTPSKAKRLGETPAAEMANTNPVVLLAGAADESCAIRLRAESTPAGLPLHWSAVRADGDSDAIRALSAKPVPSLTASPDGAALAADAAGTFLLRATAGEAADWGGPFVQREIVFVHAAVAENSSSVNGRFCACARVPGTDEFRLHSGTGGVLLEASVTLTGGGPDGQRGVEEIYGGWMNNIVSDNAGARYKGGAVRQKVYRYEKDGGQAPVDFDEGPLLDSPGGEIRCVAGGGAWPLKAKAGEPVGIEARIAPGTSWKVQDGAAAIEQIWRYLECRSYLALWSAHAPGQLGILLQTGWSFTGDYACTPAKTTRTNIPARLAATGTVQFPALLPAALTGLEAHPPATGERGDA